MAKNKIKEVKHGIASFNADHYAGVSEADFIKAELAGLPDSIGDEAKKVTFLKEAYGKMNAKSEKAVADKK